MPIITTIRGNIRPNAGKPFNPMTASTGGTITEISGYRVHTFSTGSQAGNTYTFTSSSSSPIEYLIVAGGAAGAWDGGGGGGAGGYRAGTFSVIAQSYSIVVGAGGLQVGTAVNSNPGGNSSAFSITSNGGGGGGARGSNGLSGGSGGGSTHPCTSCSGGAGTPGQGNNGGNGGNFGGGGGGGAGSAGFSGDAANGGNAIANSITGTLIAYAGGGGGGTYQGSGTGLPGSASGIRSGGFGVIGSNTQGGLQAGVHGTGGGGGGGGVGGTFAGDGGSGTVIIRYPF